jgi:hypothetical protein
MCQRRHQTRSGNSLSVAARDFPTNKGGLCRKGWTAAELLNSPDRLMIKPDLIKAVREQGLKSVSSVFAALAEGREDARSKPALASLLSTIWTGE